MSATQTKSTGKAETANGSRDHQTGSTSTNAVRSIGADEGQWTQSAGNLAVQHLFAAGAIRAKLNISQPNDPDEEEANRAADRIMRMEDPGPMSLSPGAGHSKCAACEAGGTTCSSCAEEEPVQRKEHTETTSHQSSSLHAQIPGLRGGGEPLSPSARAFFEPRFGRSFSGVRVYTDASANRAAKAIGARAFTLGSDIAFARNQFSPETTDGTSLLAHELAHVGQRAGRIQRDANTCSSDDNASYAPDVSEAEPQECSLYGPAKAEHPADFDPCAVDVSALSNYEVLAELNTALERVALGEEAEGFFDWRNLGRRLQAEVAKRAQAGHIWMQVARGEIPGTLVRVSDNLIDGSMTVARVPGASDAGEGWDIHLTPLMTEEQFQQFLSRQQIETIRIEEYRRQMIENRLAAMSSTMVTGGGLYNTALDPRLIDPFSRPSLSASGQPIQKWMGRLGEAGYESTAASGFGFGVNDLNANPWVDRRGRVHGPTEENYPIFDFENAPAFARILGTARISVKTSGQAAEAARFEVYRRGMAEMYETSSRSGLPSYISNQPQFAGQPTTGPQYEANRSAVLSDAYIAVNRDDAAAFRDLLSNPNGRETATGPTLWEDTGFQAGQRPRASWRAVYEGVMREEPIRVNGVDYNSPDALDQAHHAGHINAQDFELAQREVGERAARRVVAHAASTTDLVNLRTARPSLNAIPDAQLPSLLTPEYMRTLRAGGGIGGEFTAAGGASVKGGGAGGIIAVVTTMGVMMFDEADHPNWERELGTAGTLGVLGGTTGSATEQLLISAGTRSLLSDAAAGTSGTFLTRGMVTTGGRFGGGGVGAGVVELASMGFFEDRSHSGLEYAERTGRAFVIGGASTVIGAEAGAGATVLTSALVGAAAGSEVPIIGNIIGFIVGLGVGAFVYYEADKHLPGGRADWDAAEAARQEGCQRRRASPSSNSDVTDWPHGFHCFDSTTPVAMADGRFIPIAEIVVGDLILSYHEQEACVEARRVTAVDRFDPDHMLRIVCTGGSSFSVTALHKLMSGIGWKKAGDLRPGDVLRCLGEKGLDWMTVLSIQPEAPRGDLYDLNVEGTHTYFAGGALAHNKNI